VAVFGSACGSGSDSNKSTGSEPAVTIPADRKAKDLLPDLTSLGYKIALQEADPGAQLTGQDAYRAIYQKGAGPQSALVYLLLFPDTQTAQKEFATRATALKNPPPEFVGGATTFVDTASPRIGDEQKSYETSTKDNQGNRVWTDIYRMGRLVAVIQVLDSADSDQLQAREAIAKEVQAKTR
jgi:hypothetical protein